MKDRWIFAQTQPPTMYRPPDQQAVVPAIAIPVEAKDAFECPKEHIEDLKECLPRVTKMVTIGWRATEDEFLKLLNQGLSQSTSLMVVAGEQEEALEIGRKLRPGRRDPEAAAAGFTETILSRAIESFLWRPSLT